MIIIIMIITIMIIIVHSTQYLGSTYYIALAPVLVVVDCQQLVVVRKVQLHFMEQLRNNGIGSLYLGSKLGQYIVFFLPIDQRCLLKNLFTSTVYRTYNNRKSLISKQIRKMPWLHSKRRRGGHLFDSFFYNQSHFDESISKF